MEKLRKKRFGLSKIAGFARANPQLTKKIAVAAALVVLAVSLCISISMRSHIQSEYTAARTVIEKEICSDLYMLCQTFDQVSVPGQDVENTVMHAMRDYWLSAVALNDVLADGFGDRSRILRPDTVTMISAAFEAYEEAFAADKSTSGAEEAMRGCIGTIRGILDVRYKDGIQQ